MPPETEFRPPFWLRGAHRQTIWANYAPRTDDGAALIESARTLVLDTEDGDRLQVHWNAPVSRHSTPSNGRPATGGSRASAPVLIVLHGLTGCARSRQVLGLAAKGLAAGFEVVRADMRNSTAATPSVGIGHAGRSEDACAIIEHVRARRPGAPIAIIGYSLGGNVTLKAMGEYCDAAPEEIRAVAAISVPIDLDAACTAIDGAGNWHYRTYFVRRLVRLVRARASEEPRYAELRLDGVVGLREFDGAVVAPLCGFRDASDYYARSSSLAVMDRIRVPTLLVQAVDDPFIPFHPFEDARLRNNPAIRLLAPRRGGHAGFYGHGADGDADAFWADNRAVEFCAEAVR